MQIALTDEFDCIRSCCMSPCPQIILFLQSTFPSMTLVFISLSSFVFFTCETIFLPLHLPCRKLNLTARKQEAVKNKNQKELGTVGCFLSLLAAREDSVCQSQDPLVGYQLPAGLGVTADPRPGGGGCCCGGRTFGVWSRTWMGG